MTTYRTGATVRLVTLFTVAGVPTDPSTVTLKLQDPAGALSTFTLAAAQVIQDGPGSYHRDFVATLAGTYVWRWEGTGAAAGVDEGTTQVEASLLVAGGTDLCTLADVKLARPNSVSASRDELIEMLIAHSSHAITRYTGRQFLRDPVATDRYFELAPFTADSVPIDDLSAEPLEVEMIGRDGLGPTTVSLTDVVALPRNRDDDQPITRLRLRRTGGLSCGQADLRVRGVWGFPAVPLTVKLACIVAVVDYLKDAQALTSQSPEQFEPGAPPARGLPLKSRNLLSSYRRRMGMA